MFPFLFTVKRASLFDHLAPKFELKMTMYMALALLSTLLGSATNTSAVFCEACGEIVN
jgi:hypothetical protein